jgi:hypothetical protein
MAARVTAGERQRRRAVIQQRVADGESQRSIADALGVSRALVQKELRAIREGETVLDEITPRAETNRVRVEPKMRSGAVIKAPGIGHSSLASASLKTILPPPDHFSQWKRLDLDRNTWAKADANELVTLLINISPDASRAVWDWLRLLNSGHKITARKVGTQDPDPRAQARLDEFIQRIEGYHGSFKVVAGRLFMAAITRGAFFAELVLDETGRVPIDIATPDPATVRFRRVEDEERGEIWEPGQWQGGEFVSFNVPTIRYIGVDPEPGNPYGRPMLAPAVFPCVFLIGLLNDLRRVVAQQGYPRTDIVVRLENLRAVYADLSMKEFEAKVAELIAGVQGDYAGLEPDDAYVHTDPIEVTKASGAVDTSVTRGVGELISALERMAMRALKTMPILMGVADGVAEARANREWEIFGEYVSHLQHYAEKLLGRLFELSLQVQGIQAKVDVTFASVRSADALRDEQTLQLKLANAEQAEAAGYMDRDEASEHAVGHPAATEERVSAAPEGDTGASDIKAEPGEDRSTRALSDDHWPETQAGAPVLGDARLRAAIETWEEVFADDPEKTLLDADPAEDGDDGGNEQVPVGRRGSTLSGEEQRALRVTGQGDEGTRTLHRATTCATGHLPGRHPWRA